ncbi:MAG: LacI family DNA-binding transcriptional regulator [Spirochaetota bacterium]
MNRVTIRDVAERAGVSTSTVSRTLHNSPRISAETKQRVLDAVREMNYQTHLHSRNDAVRAIGLVLPGGPDDLFANAFFPRVLRGVSSYAQARGYLSLYAFSHDEEEKLGYLRQFLHSASVHGCILLAVHQRDRCIDFLVHEELPFAVVGRPETPGQLLWVDNDNFHAMYEVVNRLVEQGARRIAFIGGPPEMNVTRDRLEGYRMALANRGLDLLPELVGFAREFSEGAGRRSMLGMLAHVQPDAFVATDDVLGLGAMRALADRGLHGVPGVGFNNTPEAARCVPPLSSVDIRPEELGRSAARLLIDRIERGDVAENHVIVPTSFVERRADERVSV